MGVIKFFGSAATFIRIASPIEPETHRALKAYRGLPPIDKQFEINEWVKDVKTAAGLPHGVDNLHLEFDIVYLFAVNNVENAKIDFVTGTKRAHEEGTGGSLDFEPWKGFYSKTTNRTSALFSGWMVNTGPNSTPLNHHVHLSILRSFNTSSTGAYFGHTGYAFTPLQNVSGVMRLRINHFGGINNFLNDDIMGSYTIKRESNILTTVQKNDSGKLNGNRTYTSYPDLEFSVSGLNNGTTAPSSALMNTPFGSLTAGRGDSIDGNLLNLADYNYFIKQGINLRTYEGGYSTL